MTARSLLGRRQLPLRDLRPAALAMLALGLALPYLPGAAGLTCPLRALTGVPCPLCGMTTSVIDTLRLDLAGALAANPAGIVAVAGALLLLIVRPSSLALPRVLLPLTLASMWLFELGRFGLL